jgi:diguanylate cyclase (GGDEF)-like protein
MIGREILTFPKRGAQANIKYFNAPPGRLSSIDDLRPAPEPATSITQNGRSAVLPSTEDTMGKIASGFNAFLSGCSSLQVGVLSFLFAVLVGLLDHITGYELSFSIFYIAPISVASWYGGRDLGVSACVASSIIWLVVDLSAGHLYSHRVIVFWNAGVRLAFFALVSLLLSSLRARLNAEQKLAQSDALTGLLNSRAFRDSAGKVFDFCRRIDRPATVVYIDLENYKKLNDTLGHTEGDRVLRSVGSTLSQGLRSTDIVGRLGGDEFALVLPDTNPAQARMVMEKLLQKLAAEVASRKWPIGFSIGVAIHWKPPASADEAIKSADNLLYRVKQSGKNNISYEVFGAADSPGQPSEPVAPDRVRRG